MHFPSNKQKNIDADPETAEELLTSLEESKGNVTINDGRWMSIEPKIEISTTEAIQSPIESNQSMGENEIEMFCRSTAAQLKMLPAKQATLASEEIQGVFNKYRLKNVQIKKFR